MATDDPPPRRRRLGRDDWADAAVQAIAESGLSGVAVEPLARRLGVTKGSFYAHFANRDELVTAALDRWADAHGEVLDGFPLIDDPAERLRSLFGAATVFTASDRPSAHVRLLGELSDPRVRDAVNRATDARVAIVAEAFRELGLSRARAQRRAQLVHAGYTGLLIELRETGRPRSAVEARRLADELADLFIPS